MTKYRRAAKRDASELEIVKALEAVGWIVYRDLPCDLLCFRAGIWRTLECKTPTKSGKAPKRKDQPEQDAFLALTNTPKVCTPFQAIAELSK